LMAAAADAFKPVLDSVEFRNPKIPLYSNVTGKRVESGEEAKRLAFLQITSPVRWVDEQAEMCADGGFDACLEVGPGKVLRGLWMDSGSGIPCLTAGTVEEVNSLDNNLEKNPATKPD
ncbi:MAG: malonyl CoA-ACP transacylase, partial [Treponema sp.]|nr:malonyl CoA-ACP transacylase [Treponema sp.]